MTAENIGNVVILQMRKKAREMIDPKRTCDALLLLARAP